MVCCLLLAAGVMLFVILSGLWFGVVCCVLCVVCCVLCVLLLCLFRSFRLFCLFCFVCSACFVCLVRSVFVLFVLFGLFVLCVVCSVCLVCFVCFVYCFVFGLNCVCVVARGLHSFGMLMNPFAGPCPTSTTPKCLFIQQRRVSKIATHVSGLFVATYTIRSNM